MSRRRPSRLAGSTSLANLFSRFSDALGSRWSALTGEAAPASAGAKIARAVRYGMERLEPRTLFTIIGPLDPSQLPNAPGGPDGMSTNGFEFLDGAGTTVRVYWHHMTAELIGVTVDNTDTPAEADLTPDTFSPVPTVTANLYTIYIMQSSMDSWLSIADVPPITTPGPRNMQPFNSPPTLSVNNAGTGPARVSYNEGLGGVLLGALHNGSADSGVPVINEVPFGVGVVPGPFFPSGNFLDPGVYMAPTAIDMAGVPVLTAGLQTPNDLGRFFFGGTITGNVNIPAPAAGTPIAPIPASQGGNVGVFYAGSILTGDARGIAVVGGTDAATLPPNFVIAGDVRDIVSGGAIGGDILGGGTLDNAQYFTGFHGMVHGTVGEIFEKTGSLFGSMIVLHDPAVYGLPSNLFQEQELERQVRTAANIGDAEGIIFQGEEGPGFNFPNFFDPSSSVRPPQLAATQFSNDLSDENQAPSTFGTPQYLGAVKQTDPKTGLPLRDTHGNFVYAATVQGLMEGATPTSETIDNYAVPLMAGQTITVTASTATNLISPLLLTPAEYVRVVDPDGRTIASDESNVNPNQTLDHPFSFVADRAGIYTFSVILLSVDVRGAVTNLINSRSENPYTLTIQGFGDLALGTVAATSETAPTGNIFNGGFGNAIEIGNGDLGALLAGGDVASEDLGSGIGTPRTSVIVGNGNLRVIKASSLGISPITFFQSESVIQGPTGFFGYGIFLDVPHGSVGLLQAYDATGTLDVSTRFVAPNTNTGVGTVPFSAVGGDFQMINGAGTVFLDIACNQAIGNIIAGNMATNFASYIEVNADNSGNDGKIDLIDCQGDFGTAAAGGPGIVTNAGGDVRYIKVTGTVFRDAAFGPANNPDAVIHAPGVAVGFTDDSGATFTLTPIGPVYANPNFNPADAQTNEADQPTLGPQIITTDYPIRGSGGSVLINVSVASTTNVDAAGNPLEAGLSITSNNVGVNAVAEIGRIQVEGNSTAVFASNGPNDGNGVPTVISSNTPGAGTTGTVVTPTAPPTLSLNISGNTEIDVLNVVVSQLVDPTFYVFPTSTLSVPNNSVTPNLGNINTISNNTPHGELARVLAYSIGTLFSRGTLGVAKHSTAEAVLPFQPITTVPSANANLAKETGSGNGRFSTSGPADVGGIPGEELATYPFYLQKTGVNVGQSIQNLQASEGIGNVQANGGYGTINPHFDGVSRPGVFAGIIGPIVAAPMGSPTIAANNSINTVQIGDGIQSAGTGAVSFGGIYAVEQIGSITGSNADIRGEIEAELQIVNISLANGSLIDADVLSMVQRVAITISGTVITGQTFANAFQQGVEFITTLLGSVNFLPQIVENPQIQLSRISIGGNGGVIGSLIASNNIGTINVGGFGILNSLITTFGTDRIGSIVAAGYGIRGTAISAGSQIGTIGLTGNGQNLSTNSVSPSVRLSENLPVDPITGIQINPFTLETPNALNDIHQALGTSKASPVITGVTDTGVLEDDIITDGSSLVSLSARTIRVSEGIFTPIPFPFQNGPNIPQPAQPYPMQINIADIILNLQVRGLVDGLSITTGRLGQFHLGGSVSRMGLTVAGAIANMTVPGNFGQIITDPITNTQIPDSYIQAIGTNGSIGYLRVNGNLYGNVTATGRIVSMSVLGSVFGNITAQGQSTGLTLGYLRIGGSLKDGSLTVNGNAGSIITNGGLGDAAGLLTIRGNLNLLMVGASHAHGSILASAIHVQGKLGTLYVYGQIAGAIAVDSDVRTLYVINDGTNANNNVINGNITIGGRLFTGYVLNGNVAANVIANGFINNFVISKGSVLGGTIVQSQLDAIRNFSIIGGANYSLFGTLLAAGGLRENINISGNVGGGATPATIAAFSGNRIHIGGSILAGASISLADVLNLLQVDGDIAAGAHVSAHPLKNIVVKGINNGTIIAV